MIKLFLLLVISLVAAIPATAIYIGLLSMLKPLLDKLRFGQHADLIVKSHRA